MRGLLLLLLFAAACDSVPEEGDALVVEAFFDVGRPLPDVQVRRTAPAAGLYPDSLATALSDADVRVSADGAVLLYEPVPGRPGRYRAAAPGVVAAGTRYRVEVRWQARVATAETRTPPPLRIDSLRALPFSAPVRAVLLDSLRFDTLGTGAREGYVYPVEVYAWWAGAPVEEDTVLWLRTQLRPAQPFGSGVVDLFFPPERIAEERSFAADAPGTRLWRGLYAVPVADAAAPLPPHRVRVAVVRSGRDYARFAATRTAPVRREPIGNVVGGLGIVAGISVDSLTLVVGNRL